MSQTRRTPYRATPDERRALRERRGIPSCPECLEEMDRVTPDHPIREGGWTPRRCTACGRLWEVYVANGDGTRRVTGYTLRAEDDPASEEGETNMSKMKKAKGTPATQGIEAAKAEDAARKRTKKTPAAPDEPAVELLIDQKGIHSLTAGAEPVEAPQLAKAKEPKAPAQTAGTPEQADDSETEVVFALRIRRSDRDLLHEVAGSGKASRIVKQLIIAATHGDRNAIEQVLTSMHGTGR